MLWSFQTGAGANDTPVVFEQDGKQYVAFLAAGNSLAATAHGDNLWLFSLDGTLDPAAAPGTGTGTEHAGEGGGGGTGDAAAGKTIFADNCAGCHGALGTGGNGGPDLTAIPSAKDKATVIKQVTNGGGGMPAFKGQLSEQQIDDVATYVTSEITNK
jgi:alcohol dehydrogenase (cytochrome c)